MTALKKEPLLKSVKRSVSFDADVHAWLESTAGMRRMPFCTLLNDVLRRAGKLRSGSAGSIFVKH